MTCTAGRGMAKGNAVGPPQERKPKPDLWPEKTITGSVGLIGLTAVAGAGLAADLTATGP
jgi:hypothetical protein